MKKVSGKRELQLIQYHELKKEYGRKHRYNMRCFLCGKKIEIPTREPNPVEWFDFHHIYGKRENYSLIQPGYYEPVHRKCHNDYHDKPASNIPWFGFYLNRIRKTHKELFEKERLRYGKNE